MEAFDFDFSLYFSLFRMKRKKAGYIKASDFVNALKRNTGVQISTNTLYKIEQGKQPPTLIQFMALNLFLYGHTFPNNDLLNACIPSSWRQEA